MAMKGWITASVRMAILSLLLCTVSLTSLRTFQSVWLALGPLLAVALVRVPPAPRVLRVGNTRCLPMTRSAAARALPLLPSSRRRGWRRGLCAACCAASCLRRRTSPTLSTTSRAASPPTSSASRRWRSSPRSSSSSSSTRCARATGVRPSTTSPPSSWPSAARCCTPSRSSWRAWWCCGATATTGRRCRRTRSGGRPSRGASCGPWQPAVRIAGAARAVRGRAVTHLHLLDLPAQHLHRLLLLVDPAGDGVSPA